MKTRLWLHVALAITLVTLVFGTVFGARFRTSPRSDAPDSLNALDFIPDTLRQGIRARTGTTDVSTYLQAAITEACASTGGAPKRLYLPAGLYPIGASGLLVDACHGFELAGPSRSLTGQATLTLKGNMFTANSGALLKIVNTVGVTISNLEFVGVNFIGDAIHLSKDQHVKASGIKISSFLSGHAVAHIITVDTGADSFTISSYALSQFPNGTPVEVWTTGTGAAPGGLSASNVTTTTVYYVVGASGTTRQLALTVGGAPVDITSACTAFNCGLRKASFSSSAADASAETITIPGVVNPFVEGQRVEGVDWTTTGFGLGTACPTDQASGQTLTGRGLYVRNPTSNPNTFQLSYTIGGAAININAPGTIANCRWTASYSGIRGGGNLYAYFDDMYISAGYARTINFTVGETEEVTVGSYYYGVNVGSLTRSIIYGTMRIGSASGFQISDNTVEASCLLPNQCQVDISDPLTSVAAAFINNYMEQGGGSIPNCGVYLTGGTLERNLMYGTEATETGSYAVRLGSTNAGGVRIHDNNFIGYANTMTFLPSVGNAFTSSGNLYDWSNNSSSSDVTQSGPTNVAQVVAADGTTANRPIAWYDSKTGIRTQSGQLGLGLSSATDPTVLNLKYGNYFQAIVSSGSTIGTVLNANEGRNVWIKGSADGIVLSAAAFATPTGANLPLCGGGSAHVFVDKDDAARVALPMGATVECRKLTGQSGDIATANLFSANPTAGMYELCAYATTTSAGSAGTQDVVFGWTDAAGARTATVVNDVALDSTAALGGCAIAITSGSAQMTYAVTQTGAAGSPVYALQTNVRRLQ